MKLNKIANLLDKKRKIEKQIEDIQKKCPHFSKSIKSIRENVDSTNTVIRWVCDDCTLVVGYPTDFETTKYLKE